MRNTTDDERLLQNKFKKKWCVYVCVCKKVLKLQLSNNKDIELTFIYVITSSCVSASSFAVLDIIFLAPLFTKWMLLNRSHLVLGFVFYSYFRYKVVSRILHIFCELTNHFFHLPWDYKFWLIFTTITPQNSFDLFNLHLAYKTCNIIPYVFVVDINDFGIACHP